MAFIVTLDMIPYPETVNQGDQRFVCRGSAMDGHWTHLARLQHVGGVYTV